MGSAYQRVAAAELTASPASQQASTLELLGGLARPYFLSPHQGRRTVWLQVALLLGMCAARTGLFVVISYVQRDFNTALAAKDEEGFSLAVRHFVGTICVSAPLFAWYSYLEGLFVLRWRRWLG